MTQSNNSGSKNHAEAKPINFTNTSRGGVASKPASPRPAIKPVGQSNKK